MDVFNEGLDDMVCPQPIELYGKVFSKGGFSCWTRLFIMVFEYCSRSHMHLSILTVIIYFPHCYKYGLARGEIGACIMAMVSLLGRTVVFVVVFSYANGRANVPLLYELELRNCLEYVYYVFSCMVFFACRYFCRSEIFL